MWHAVFKSCMTPYDLRAEAGNASQPEQCSTVQQACLYKYEQRLELLQRCALCEARADDCAPSQMVCRSPLKLQKELAAWRPRRVGGAWTGLVGGPSAGGAAWLAPWTAGSAAWLRLRAACRPAAAAAAARAAGEPGSAGAADVRAPVPLPRRVACASTAGRSLSTRQVAHV